MAANGAIAVEHALTAGSDVWLNDAKEGWLKARVKKIDGTTATVLTEAGDEATAEIEALPLQNSDGRSGVEVRAWLSRLWQPRNNLFKMHQQRSVSRSFADQCLREYCPMKSPFAFPPPCLAVLCTIAAIPYVDMDYCLEIYRFHGVRRCVWPIVVTFADTFAMLRACAPTSASTFARQLEI